MATEGYLNHDGAQTVAAANYSNGAGGLGDGGSMQFLAVMLTSAGRTSVLASAAGQQIYGILQNKPALGEAADVGLQGVSKAIVGSAGVTAGSPIMVDATGSVVNWSSGSAYAQIGYAIETGVQYQVAAVYLFGSSNKVLT
jgi:hypothetical protein